MKVKSDFIIHNRENESLLVSTGASDFNGLVRGNKIFGDIVGLMEEDTTEDQIVASMLERYDDATEEQVRRDVVRVIAELRGIGALDE